MSGHSHSHEGVSHSHAGGDHGHSHEILDGPGSFLGREMPIIEGRDWKDRAFTIGIGGYVRGCALHSHSTLPTPERAPDMHRTGLSGLAKPP